MSNTISSEEILSLLKQEIQNYEVKTEVSETGHIIRAGDGIATVYGIENAMYGEMVEFETGVKGIVQSLE